MQRPFVELFSGGDGGRSIKEGPRPREGRGGERGEGKAARCGVAWWRGGGAFRSLAVCAHYYTAASARKETRRPQILLLTRKWRPKDLGRTRH